MIKNLARLVCVAVGVSVLSQPAFARTSQPTVQAVHTVDLEKANEWLPMLQPSDEQYVTIPIEVSGKRVVALVDTGVSNLMVDSDWAAKNGITASRSLPSARTVDGKTMEQSIAPMKSVLVGGLGEQNGSIVVVDLGAIGRAIGQRIDAVVGANFLHQYSIEFDFDNRRMRFQPAGKPPPAGSRIGVRFDAIKHRIFTTLSVGTSSIQPAMIDTGDNGYLGITRRAFTSLPTMPRRITDVDNVAMGGSTSVVDYFRLDGIRVGTTTVSHIPTYLRDRLIDDDTQAVIGSALLGRYNVFLDATAGVMVLAVRTTPPIEPAISTSGIQFSPTRQGLHIEHIMKNSPAASSDLKLGDIICTVDGGTALDHMDFGRKSPGRTITLGLCNGRTVNLTLAEFY